MTGPTRTQKRAILARRAAVTFADRPAKTLGAVGTDIRARVPERKVVTGPVKHTRAAPMSRAMRSGDGSGMSLWGASMTLTGDTATIGNDRKWSSTVRDMG